MAGAAVCLLILNAGPRAAQPLEAAPSRERQIRALFERDIPRLLAENTVTSISIAHIEAGIVVFTGAYGMQAPGIVATTKTLYNIASLSKPISAEVILRLASKNRLTLDEPMYIYWTDPDIANDERRKLLTPRIALPSDRVSELASSHKPRAHLQACPWRNLRLFRRRLRIRGALCREKVGH